MQTTIDLKNQNPIVRKKRVVLALGSNIEPRKQYIESAIKEIKENPEFRILNITPMIENPAILYENQPDFLNQVIEIETSMDPYELLNFVKVLEKKIGRKERFRYGPREIDIDILFYENLHIKSEILMIPHPGVYDRDYLKYLLRFIDISYYGFEK
ncbi:MAG: 2-amino-4-hydroxy-6-hydroxymethyldihydropteridine diphosphokinase [Leptospiraceae bacterium]|nr:2-amino-4-hydroxy-6-hydroxymethyldihydropteridine diphosphokinase [Leptospiraceae bacterium]MDW7976187.1 2-amino-4-hydroxy-6-hydroxymethyldihydropteridine diphosphokinase [Leptospiraceae bacterium]